jgi:hypothetical protein
MKKYFLLFAVSSFIGISHAIAQSPVTTTATGQSVIVPDSVANSESTSKGTISKAGKNQQSVYTRPTGASQTNDPGAASPAQQASPNKEQPAVIDPKRQR